MKTLRATQVVSVAVVLLVAFTMWGVEKMLFKIAEREQLRNRNAELEAQVARIPILERLNAEQAARIAELAARIAELENQKAQQNDEERR